METNNTNNFQQPVQQPVQQVPVQQPVQQVPQVDATPASETFFTPSTLNPTPAPAPIPTPTDIPELTAESGKSKKKEKPVLNSTEKALKKITILLIAVLAFNVISLGIIFFIGGNNALSADEVMATIDNLYEYAYETGEDNVELSGLEYKNDSVSFTIKNTSDEKLPVGIVLLECVNDKDEVINLRTIPFGELEAGETKDIDGYPIYNDDVKNVRLKHVLTILPSDSELLSDMMLGM